MEHALQIVLSVDQSEHDFPFKLSPLFSACSLGLEELDAKDKVADVEQWAKQINFLVPFTCRATKETNLQMTGGVKCCTPNTLCLICLNKTILTRNSVPMQKKVPSISVEA